MSSYRMTAKMDNKGRLLLPRKLRDSLRLSSGDTLFLQFESKSGIVRLAKASSPFDVLADEAEKELEAGRTTNIREYARKRGITPDE